MITDHHAEQVIEQLRRIADSLEAAVEEMKEINDTLAGIEEIDRRMHERADPNVRYHRRD